MALTITGSRNRSWRLASLERVPLVAWCALAVALFVALVFFVEPVHLATSLGDTDDATRLIEVRELLGGAPWFDTTLPRFGGAHPLVSHWSRLVDAPLAMLLGTFELVLPQAQAELLLRAVWPPLVLLAFLYLLAREAEIRSGRTAALVLILLTVTLMSVLGVEQFMPGRIDHHNVLILCAVIGILRLARSFDDPGAGWSAGFFLGLGTAVGYEALALTAVSLGAAILFGSLPRRSLLGPSRAALVFAATLTIALALTTARDALFVSRCDDLSINLVLLSAIGALGVCSVQAFEHVLSSVLKIVLLAATGLVGIAIFGLVEPACLAGPFGQVDPAVFPVWLDNVSETQSLLSLGSKLPLVGGMAFVYFLIGAYCGFRLMQTDREDGLRFHMLAFLLAIPLSVWQIKLMPYATFLPIPLLAIWLARPPDDIVPRSSKRAIAVIGLGALLVIGAAAWVLHTAAPSVRRVSETIEPIRRCLSNAAIAPLAHLPKGLVVADRDLGPFLVALTDLDVLAAPYHRMDKAILEADGIQRAKPQVAEKRLKAIGARYVIICEGHNLTTSPDGLQSLLFAGKAPSYLEPVPLGAPTPYKVWRVKP